MCLNGWAGLQSSETKILCMKNKETKDFRVQNILDYINSVLLNGPTDMQPEWQAEELSNK